MSARSELRAPLATTLVIAVLIVAAARSWGPLQFWLRDRVPDLPAIIAALTVLCAVTLLHAGVARTASKLVLPVILGLAIWHNVRDFERLNDDPWRLEPRDGATLLHQARTSPQSWAREQLGLYLYLHDHLAGARVVVPPGADLDPWYLRVVTGVREIGEERYDPELSPQAAARLLAREHAVFDRPDGTIFVVVTGDAPEGYRLYRAGHRRFLCPPALVGRNR